MRGAGQLGHRTPQTRTTAPPTPHYRVAYVGQVILEPPTIRCYVSDHREEANAAKWWPVLARREMRNAHSPFPAARRDAPLDCISDGNIEVEEMMRWAAANEYCRGRRRCCSFSPHRLCAIYVRFAESAIFRILHDAAASSATLTHE